MKLLTILTLAACFTILPSCVTAEEIWKKGDTVAAFFICKKEKDIMEISLADSKGREYFLNEIAEKQLTNDCISINPPVIFKVDEIIASYKDYKGIEALIMKVRSPRNSLLVGYIVAAGIPDKGI